MASRHKTFGHDISTRSGFISFSLSHFRLVQRVKRVSEKKPKNLTYKEERKRTCTRDRPMITCRSSNHPRAPSGQVSDY